MNILKSITSIKIWFRDLAWWQQVLMIVFASTGLILCAGYLGVFLSNHQLGWGGSERPLTGTNKGIET